MSIEAIFKCCDSVCIFYILGKAIPSAYSGKEKGVKEEISTSRIDCTSFAFLRQ